MDKTEGLYKFYWDCRRQGSVDGLFVCEKWKVDWLVENGAEIYLGEILGKHSEISGTLDKQDVKLITDDLDFIQKFKELQLETGYNPIQYYEDGGGEYKEE